MSNKIEKAKRLRKGLDVTMAIFAIVLGGFLLTAFTIAMVKIIVGAWVMGLGFIPLVTGGVALFLLFWSILDKKVDKTLEGKEEENG